jgi:hypothetical protein
VAQVTQQAEMESDIWLVSESQIDYVHQSAIGILNSDVIE